MFSFFFLYVLGELMGIALENHKGDGKFENGSWISGYGLVMGNF